MAGVQRRFRRGNAAERSAAIHRSRGRRQRRRNVGQDCVDVGQRVTGELPRGDFRLKARLHIGEIGGVSPDAAKSLATFFDRVLPQTALERARSIIERQAKIRESWSRGCGTSSGFAAAAASTTAGVATTSTTTAGATTRLPHGRRLRRRHHSGVGPAIRHEVIGAHVRRVRCELLHRSVDLPGIVRLQTFDQRGRRGARRAVCPKFVPEPRRK